MEERILEAVEYITISLDDIKDYQDFIKYKPELMKAINDIKNIVQKKIQINENDTIEKGETDKSKLSSILGLQFDYDPLINEEDVKFFSEYEEKNKNNDKKIKERINNKNNIVLKKLNNNNKNNSLRNPDNILNCTESLRNKNKLLNKKNNNTICNLKKNINKEIIKSDVKKYYKEKNKKEKIDIITDIIIKINNKDYLYNILTKLFGDNLSDKLLSNQVSDELLESLQNAILEIEKINEKYKKINNINERIEKLYQEKTGIMKNKKREEDTKENNINSKYNFEHKNFFYRPKMYKTNSFHTFKYSEPYQEFNFNKSLRNQTYNTFNKMQKRDNSMNQSKINSKNKKINFNSKSSEHSKKILSHKRPFISATCGYGKYFDEPLQKGGESKLN